MIRFFPYKKEAGIHETIFPDQVDRDEHGTSLHGLHFPFMQIFEIAQWPALIKII